jgi:hypothetical protein
MTRKEAMEACQPFFPTSAMADHVHVSVPLGALKKLMASTEALERVLEVWDSAGSRGWDMGAHEELMMCLEPIMESLK